MEIQIDDVVCTGSTGSIGTFMPKGIYILHTRLENTIEEMKNEIKQHSIKNWAFVHLAGMIDVRACEKAPQLAWSINVEGSKKWFQAACQTECKHFVLVSTSHVFSPPKNKGPLTPDSSVGPRSVYGRTKLAAEEALYALAAEYPHTKLTVARVFSVLSEAMRPGFLLTSLHNKARNRDFSPIPGLSCIRDFLEAPDICQRLVKLARTPSAPSLVLICSGKGRSIREVAEHVFEQYGLDTCVLQEATSRADDIPYLVGVPSTF